MLLLFIDPLYQYTGCTKMLLINKIKGFVESKEWKIRIEHGVKNKV